MVSARPRTCPGGPAGAADGKRRGVLQRRDGRQRRPARRKRRHGAPPPKPGNFTAYGGRCTVGYFSDDPPRYYVLLSGASPVARGLVSETDGGYAVVPCPASSGFFRCRVVTESGAVVEVPVSVGGLGREQHDNGVCQRHRAERILRPLLTLH